MEKEYDLGQDTQMNRWDEFVRSCGRATVFHLSSWLRLVAKTYGYEPLLRVHPGSGRELEGLCPFLRVKSLLRGGQRLVSLPFSDYGGPLFKETEAEVAVMQEVFATNAARLGCIEIRGEASLPVRCQRKEHFKRHWLELSLGLPEVRKRLDKRTIQYSINKALRNGVAVREDNTREGLLEFMRLNELTRRKHGVPCQPARFFEGILEHMIGPGHGFVLLAQHGSANIAGGLFLTCGDTMYYKFNASDPVALSKLCPNHLLTWHAIEKGVAEGYRCLDFGRTATANEGLIRYKEMWGAKAEPIPYYYYPRAEGASAHEEDGPRHLLMLAAWRMLPQSAARRVSERIYGYFG